MLALAIGASLTTPMGKASAVPLRAMGFNQIILSLNDGRCLDVDISSPVHNGTKVQMWDCHGGPNQLWTYFSDKSIRSAWDGRCLDMDVSSPVHNGSRIQVWDCNGWSNQQWWIWTNEPPILNSHNFMCLDEDISSPLHNGTIVQAWQCNTWPNQRWYHP